MQVTFRAHIPSKIPQIYKTKQSRANTVAVLGSSRESEQILNYMNMCSNSVKAIIQSGKNIIHGNGSKGIMGVAYAAGKTYSKINADGKPEQNLAIVTTPLYGDEDFENCITIGSTKSEAERIDEFAEVADTMLIFPGSVTTLQEAATLITKNYYGKPENKKKIILVGKDYFKGLNEQYQKLYQSGLIKCRPDELFTVVDTEDEIKNLI